MKIKSLFIAGLLLLGAATSCIKDDSESGTKPISYIELAGEALQETYTVDVPEVLTIEAPEVKQLNKQKELSYEWLLEGEVIGTESTLRYQSGKLGTFQGRLKISNEDGSYLVKFFIKAQSSFNEGVLLLSKYNDGSLLSFMRTDREEAEPATDAYTSINPTFPLGTTPYCVKYANTMYGKTVYVVTDTSGNSVALDNESMEVTKAFDSPEAPIKKILTSGSLYYNFASAGGGNFYDFDYKAKYFLTVTQNQILDAKNIKVSDECALIIDFSFAQQGFAFWDETKGELWMTFTYQYLKYYPPITLTSSKYHGYKLITALEAESLQKLNLIVKSADNTKILLVNYSPSVTAPMYGGASGDMVRGAMTEYDVTQTQVDKATTFVPMLTQPRIYYAIGNKIYAMSTTSGKADLVYEVGTSEDVVSQMVFNGDESRLYVGVNSPSGEYRGSLYCYDITSAATEKPLLWIQKAMTGEIVSMSYKR